MPTYAYACTACGHRFEVQQSFTDAALTECPECEGRLRKLFNTVGIVFKGSGFYRTDSRTTANGASKDTAADGAGGKTSDGVGSGAAASGSSSSESSSGSSGGSSGGSGSTATTASTSAA